MNDKLFPGLDAKLKAAADAHARLQAIGLVLAATDEYDTEAVVCIFAQYLKAQAEVMALNDEYRPLYNKPEIAQFLKQVQQRLDVTKEAIVHVERHLPDIEAFTHD